MTSIESTIIYGGNNNEMNKYICEQGDRCSSVVVEPGNENRGEIIGVVVENQPLVDRGSAPNGHHGCPLKLYCAPCSGMTVTELPRPASQKQEIIRRQLEC